MQKFGLQLVTGPTQEPVSLEQAKLHLRVDFNDDDSLITALIQAAREFVENKINRAIFDQTWQLTLDVFPAPQSATTFTPYSRDSYLWSGGVLDGMEISLPVPRLKSVTAITYRDSDGTTKTLDPTLYTVDANSEPARILPTNGGTWPYPSVYVSGTVKITYVAGSYTSETCPASLQQAMLLLIGAWYMQREAISAKSFSNVPLAVESLLAPYTFYQLAV